MERQRIGTVCRSSLRAAAWLLAVYAAGLAVADAGADVPAPARPRLSREWHRVSFGVGIGLSGLHAGDLAADGAPEIVAAAGPSGSRANDHWYIVSRDGEGYVQSWLSPRYPDPITSLHVAQADADSALEVLVATGDQVLIYDGVGRHLQKTLALAGAGPIRGLTVTDVDLDGARELVFCNPNDLFVVDLATGVLEFRGVGLGGRDLAVGSVDGDPAPEIVVANGVGPGFVIDGVTRAVEWTDITPGYGDFVRIADIDGNGRADIVSGFASMYGILVQDGLTHALVISVPALNVVALQILDLDADGALERGLRRCRGHPPRRPRKRRCRVVVHPQPRSRHHRYRDGRPGR